MSIENISTTLTNQRIMKERVMAELNRHRFRAPWWLRGAHAQTLFAPLYRKRPPLKPVRRRIATPDDDFLDLYFLEGDPALPRVLLMHGLEGSVQSHYMLGQMETFARFGWNVTAMEFRSCGGEMNRAPRMYHSGETTDLAFVVDWLGREFPGQPLMITGHSLGGNVLVKWLGELGDAVPKQVMAAAAVCPPFELVASGPKLDRALGGLYVRWFFRTLMPKARAKAAQFPGLVDLEKIEASVSFEDFDTHATAALHGFRDARDYYERVACGQFLEGVRRPLLLIAAEDDPFNPGSSLPHAVAASHPWLHAQFTEQGGHCGFTFGGHPRSTRHWAEEQIARFFCAYYNRNGAR